jgi:hypothetical protein
MPEPDQNLPQPEELQFRRAQPIGPDAKTCIVCKQPIAGDYFNANGNTLCPLCAQRINAHQQPPPHTSLLRAALYGGAAALAGAAIYAGVAIFLHLEIGIVAILIGYMVGKAVRYATNGKGGKAQQILAVALTYFSITISYEASKIDVGTRVSGGPQIPSGIALLTTFALAAAEPFLALFAGGRNPISALISLFIIFIGLQQAWRLTARREIVITGPYQAPA